MQCYWFHCDNERTWRPASWTCHSLWEASQYYTIVHCNTPLSILYCLWETSQYYTILLHHCLYHITWFWIGRSQPKSAELIIRTKSRRSIVDPPRAVSGFTRVELLKALDVTINNRLSFDRHMTHVLASCAQTMFTPLSVSYCLWETSQYYTIVSHHCSTPLSVSYCLWCYNNIDESISVSCLCCCNLNIFVVIWFSGVFLMSLQISYCKRKLLLFCLSFGYCLDDNFFQRLLLAGIFPIWELFIRLIRLTNVML